MQVVLEVEGPSHFSANTHRPLGRSVGRRLATSLITLQVLHALTSLFNIPVQHGRLRSVHLTTTVTPLCNDCFDSQKKCPYVALSLLRDATAVQNAVIGHQLRRPYIECPYIEKVL